MKYLRLMSVLAGALWVAGCSSDAATGVTNGTGGHASGGSSALGGAGSGGVSGTGGKTEGTGGQPTGGATGKGGAGAGGTPGTGGAALGGQSGQAGAAVGGSSGTGGVGGGAGGAAGAGGKGSGGVSSPGTGGGLAGQPGSGGTPGNGGSTGVGGAGSGGVAGAGGTTAAGGATGSGGASLPPGSGGGTGSTHWVATWATSPQLTETANNPPAALSGSTLRQVIHVSLGGSQIRVQLTNEYSGSAVTINKAHVAVCKAIPLVDSTIDTSTDKPLLFSGKESVTIAAKEAVWSDPLDFSLAPLSNVSITIAFGTAPTDVTGHPGSRTTSYQIVGSSDVSVSSMPSAKTANHWYNLSALDVMAEASAATVSVLGDSITDGKGSDSSGGNNNQRWLDDLAVRLQGNPSTPKLGVANLGVGANNLTSGNSNMKAGVDRFARDCLGQSAVKYVVVLEGVNDIGGSGASAATLTAAYDKLIVAAHAQKLLIYGATILPFGGNSYYSSSHETVRQTVNTYIKSGKFDGYIDMDAAVTDGGSPPKLKSTYDSGDGLHPSIAGHQKMADAIDLTLFSK
jgi:lysophospholipase L1-like esterase